MIHRSEMTAIAMLARQLLTTGAASAAQTIAAVDAQVGAAAQREADAANARAAQAGKAPRWTLWHFYEGETQARIVALAQALEARRPDLYTFAPINQGAVKLSPRQRQELAAVGLRAGVPDLRHDIGPRGVYVEVKAPGGSCDDDQAAFNRAAWGRGQPSYVVFSVAEWIEVIVHELADRRGPERLRDPGRKVARTKEGRGRR